METVRALSRIAFGKGTAQCMCYLTLPNSVRAKRSSPSSIVARAHGVHTLSSLQRSLQPPSLGSARSLPHSHDRVPPAHSRVLSRQEAQRRVVLLCFAMFRRFALGFEGGFIQQFSLLVRVHGLGFDDSASSNGRAVYYCPDVTARALVSLPCLRARPIVPVGVTASSYPYFR